MTRPVGEVVAQRRETVTAMTKAGYTAGEIAETVGISKRQVARHRVIAGVARPPARQLTPAEVARIEELLDDGCSYTEIHRTTGRSFMCIARRFPGRGWTKEQAADHLRAVKRMGL